jgi:hypothetical protein
LINPASHSRALVGGARAIPFRQLPQLGRMIAECAIPTIDRGDVREVVGFEDEVVLDTRASISCARAGFSSSRALRQLGLFAHAHGLLGWSASSTRRSRTRSSTPSSGCGAASARSHCASTVPPGGAALAEHRLMVLPLDQNASRRTGVFVDFWALASTNAGSPVSPS